MEKKGMNELADFIERNPNCTFVIDNDCWWIEDDEGNVLASSSDFYEREGWYGDSNTYGAAIAMALIVVLNRKGYDLKSTGC